VTVSPCHYNHEKRIKTPSLHRCSFTPSCPCKHGTLYCYSPSTQQKTTP